ncbi:MAG: leucine-rich repeat domain-containing protein, partial [Ruminococcus callidus]
TYGDLTYVLHNGNAEITGCAAGVTALEIPAKIDGSPVTAVGDSAFLKQQKLQTVSLPDSVQSIGSQAFSGCINLQEITVPAGTQSVSNSAFSGCTNLEKAVLGDSVETLGSSVFSGCESLAGCSFPPTCRNGRQRFPELHCVANGCHSGTGADAGRLHIFRLFPSVSGHTAGKDDRDPKLCL